MEVPRFWRLSPTKTGFRTETVVDESNNPQILRYPWGEIPLSGDIKEIHERLNNRGFKEEIIEEILFSIFGGVATESTIPVGEVVEGILELQGAEIGEENGSKEKFRVN